MPAKHNFATTIIPLAWIDDQLISKRKIGLTAYLNHLNTIPEYQTNEIFTRFLSSQSFNSTIFPEAVDNPPAMISRNMATISSASGEPETNAAPIAAAYYPTWSAATNPPNKIDFSKFDILFFGTISLCMFVCALICLGTSFRNTQRVVDH